MHRVVSRVYISGHDDPGREVIIPDIRTEGRKDRANLSPPSSKSSTATIEPVTVPVLLDEEIEETYLTIREPISADVVTVVEILSPTNKVKGSGGRQSFLDKRRDVLMSHAHWVEIDLLRTGERTSDASASDYRAIVIRGNKRGSGFCYLISLRKPLPKIDIPLKGKDPDVALDLGNVLQVAYDAAGYEMSIDYSKQPDPPLSPADERWASQLLRKKRLR